MPLPRPLLAGALLVGSLLVPGPAPAAAKARVSFEAASRTWTIGNALVQRAVRLGDDGKFLTASFRDLVSGREWTLPGAESSEFLLAARPASGGDGDAETMTGRSGWELSSDARSVLADGTAVLAVRLLRPGNGLEVTVHYEVFPDAPVVRTWLTVSNRGDQPVTITRADAFRLFVQGDGSAPELLWIRNFTWAHPDTAFLPQLQRFAPGDRADFTTGPFGDGAAWFALRGAGGGSGLFGGWEWSGTGAFSFATDGVLPGLVRIGAGLADGHFAHDLAPGESFTAPAGFVGFFSGGWDGAAHATRALAEARYAPPLPDASFPWAGFDTWGYDVAIDEGLVGSLIDRAADLGLETFTLDAGWMERIGDWRPRAGAFDGGIRTLAERAHARGMRFGLWMAFGVADPRSGVVKDHPGWVATDGGEPIPGDFGSVQLCLADPEVQAWVISEIDRVVDDYGVDWLLHDFGVIAACTDPQHAHQSGDGEWATTAGYYAILDAVRRRHPKLVIENCWNGGSMFDFGMLPRHDTSNTTDTNGALQGRQAVWGATYVLPPRYAGKYIADDGTPPDYRFASGLAGGPLLIMGTPTTWDGPTTAAARAAVARYKELRPILRDGALYHLTPPPAWDGWDGLLSYDAARGEGVLLAFRGGLSATFERTLFPRGLPGATALTLTCEDGPGDGTLAGGVRSLSSLGASLARGGIPVEILSPGDLAVIRLLSGDGTGRPKPR